MRPDDTNTNTNSNEIIELNVGGCSYTTSKTTILSYPDTMLSKMISQDEKTGLMATSLTDAKQRIFIDRDGPLFRHILNFFRDKRLNLPDNFSEYAQLRQEADFYRIEPILNYLDFFFSTKLNLTNGKTTLLGFDSLSSSQISLATLPQPDKKNKNNNKKPLYFTVISKLYSGTIESLIGCIHVLHSINSLDANSKRFISCLMSQSTSKDVSLIDGFVCECKFMHEEKLICCKPCGVGSAAQHTNGGGLGEANLANVCSQVVRLAKRFGITTGYWEEMFYLGLDCAAVQPNRESLSLLLNEKHNGKLLSTCVAASRSTYDENSTSSLVERWYLSDSVNSSQK